MKVKLINSQLSNWQTYEMYKRQLLTMAENVFVYKELPNFIDTSFLNKKLLRDGSIAFFEDEVLGILALPYTNLGNLDVYGRPLKIEVHGRNGYRRILNNDEFVIMYDNNGRYPLWLDILQYSERIALITRTIDINVAQQKTPRFWKTSTGKEKSIQDTVNNIDGFENIVITYDDTDVNDTSLILQPAPYVADKLHMDKDKIYNEFLRLIGIANLSYMKKERNIKDEINAMQGGTVASRFSRLEPREKAIDEINKKFGTKIEVSYYDGIPKTSEGLEEKLNGGVEENDTIL